jgi:hypothetical protein
MRITIAVLLFSLLFFEAKGQDLLPVFYDTTERNQELNIFATAEYGSSSILNSLTRHFIFGGEISDALTEKLANKQKKLNRLGFFANPTIEYINYKVQPFKKKNWGIIVKAGAFYSGAARYRAGLFGLAFRGNEPYLGQELDLSNMVFGLTGGHKVGFGFIDNKTKSSVTLNVYGISNYARVYTNSSSFKQDDTGFNAELALNGQVEFASGPFYKGIGVGVDANLFFKVGPDEKPSFLQFSFQNLGIGFLSKHVQTYVMDTTIQHDGYTFADLTNENTLFGKDKNVLDELGIVHTTNSKVIALPFVVSIAKIIDEHNPKMFQFFYGAQVYMQNGSLPMLYAGAHYKSKKWFRMGAGLSYGGFSGLRGNIYLQGAWKNIIAGLATTDVVGMIGLGKGFAYTFKLNYRF